MENFEGFSVSKHNSETTFFSLRIQISHFLNYSRLVNQDFQDMSTKIRLTGRMDYTKFHKKTAKDKASICILIHVSLVFGVCMDTPKHSLP